MKTIFESNPEFSLSFNHCGVCVTLSAKVLTQDFRGTAGCDEENEELLGMALVSALQAVAPQAAQQLRLFHEELQGEVFVAQAREYQARRDQVDGA